MSLYFALGKKSLLFYLSPYAYASSILPLSTSVEIRMNASQEDGGRGLQKVNSLSV